MGEDVETIEEGGDDEDDGGGGICRQCAWPSTLHSRSVGVIPAAESLRCR